MSRRFLLVDDEPLALSRLERLIKLVEASAVCVTATNGLEALEKIPNGPWEAVFLDVEMPALSGFEVLARLPEGVMVPPIIFCTAYSRYALQAFEEAALDYLVKPTDEDGIRRALSRSSRVDLEKSRLLELERKLAAGPAASGVAGSSALAAKIGDRVVSVPWTEIVYLRADRKLTAVVTVDREILLDKSLDTLETELPGDLFFRCHRSALVNLRHILSLDAGEEPVLRLRHNHAVPVSRRKKTELKARLGLSGP